MKIRLSSRTLFCLPLLSILGGCVQNPHPMDMTAAIQNAKTSADHMKLAEHYEWAAQDAESQAERHKKYLAAYQAAPELFPTRYDSPYWLSYCETLIKDYQRIATANHQMAALHRQLAKSTQ